MLVLLYLVCDYFVLNYQHNMTNFSNVLDPNRPFFTFFIKILLKIYLQISKYDKNFMLLKWSVSNKLCSFMTFRQFNLKENSIQNFFKLVSYLDQMNCTKILLTNRKTFHFITFFYIHKKKVLDSRKFLTSGFRWIYMF